MFALNLAGDGRVLSACPAELGAEGSPRCAELPENKLCDYKFINGSFVFEPLPVAEYEPPATVHEQIDDINLVLADILGGAV